MVKGDDNLPLSDRVIVDDGSDPWADDGTGGGEGEGEQRQGGQGQPAPQADITFSGIVDSNGKITDESQRPNSLSNDENGDIRLGQVTAESDVSFALERYDEADGSGKCGVQIKTMTMRVKMELADGFETSAGFRALTDRQKDAVVKHETVHRDAIRQHLVDVRDQVEKLNVAVKKRAADAQQKKNAEDLVAVYSPYFKNYLNQVEGIEKKRQALHFDQLNDKVWQVVGTNIRLHPTRTYKQALTVGKLKRAFTFLGNDVTTVDAGIAKVNEKWQELRDKMHTDIATNVALLEAQGS